jgi:hypothetical protein
MGEWTWLFTKFPLADVELSSHPIEPQTANVLVRTVRAVPGAADEYEVRVAPHNTAPFRGGPWVRRFHGDELTNPGEALAEFREDIWRSIQGLSSTARDENDTAAPR